MSLLNQSGDTERVNLSNQSATRLGFWTSILTALAALAALLIAITTAPARSGPNCMEELVGSCVTYPYTDVAAFVPTEYIWMVPAFLMALLFVILVLCIQHSTCPRKQIFSQTALVFAVIAATAHAINYFIQLAVVQPSLLKGELDGLALYSQYNPHGIFIALEDLGYLMMGAAFLFLGFAFKHRGSLERAIRIIFLASGVLAIGLLILFVLLYRFDLGYQYEVAAILIDWIALIVSGVLLGIYFRRAWRDEPST